MSSESKKKTYMKSLRNFPMRFRSKVNNTPEKQIESQAAKAKDITQEDEYAAETDTVSPNNVPEKTAAPTKLVVRTTVASVDNNAANESAAYQNVETAPHLVYMTSYGGNMHYPLVREETKVGRKEENHIILTDATISKFHAIVYRNSNG
jgi:hypothetical protein